MSGRKLLPYFFIGPAVIIMAALVFYPLVNGIYLSFTDANQYNTLRRIGPKTIEATYKTVGLDNYEAILSEDIYYFKDVLRQTVIWTSTNVVLHILLGLGLALLLNRPIKGRAIYRTMLIVPWAIPSYITGFAWRFLYNSQYGFFNSVLKSLHMDPIPWLSDADWSMFSVILANTWLAIPFNMVVFLGGLQSIPPDLYEAAEVDGASPFQRFRHITLPLLRPVMVVATLLGVIWTFNSFNIIFLVSEGGPFRRTEILATWAWRLGFTQNREYGIGAAYSVLILLILMVFSTIYLRVISRGGQGSAL